MYYIPYQILPESSSKDLQIQQFETPCSVLIFDFYIFPFTFKLGLINSNDNNSNCNNSNSSNNGSNNSGNNGNDSNSNNSNNSNNDDNDNDDDNNNNDDDNNNGTLMKYFMVIYNWLLENTTKTIFDYTCIYKAIDFL